MPQGYYHLTYKQRCQIYALKKSAKNQVEITMLVEIELLKNHTSFD